MKKILTFLLQVMVIISSGAFIQLLKDSGARDQGVENVVLYNGPLNAVPFVWAIAVVTTISLLIGVRQLKAYKLPLEPSALVLLGLCSSFWAPFPTVALRVSLMLLCTLILLKNYIKILGADRAAHAIAQTCFFILISSFFLIFFIPSYGIAIGTEHSGKWQGAFAHKNELGNFSAFTLLFLSWHWMNFRRKYSVIGILLSMLLIAGSQSATAIGSGLISMLIFLLFKFKNNSKISSFLKYFIPLSVAALCVALIFLSVGFVNFELFDRDSTFTARNQIWIYIISQIQFSPFFGFGLDQLSAIINDNSSDFLNNVGFLVYSAHNGFFELMYGLGLVGLLAGLALIVSLIRNYSTGNRTRLSVAYACYFILLNSFESKFLSFNIYFVFLIYCALIVRVDSQRIMRKLRYEKHDRLTA